MKYDDNGYIVEKCSSCGGYYEPEHIHYYSKTGKYICKKCMGKVYAHKCRTYEDKRDENTLINLNYYTTKTAREFISNRKPCLNSLERLWT